jgi:hypothetical protein
MYVNMNEEKSCDYLCLRRSACDDTFVTHSDRTEVVDWMYSIIDACGFDLELVAMSMGMVDRFLSKTSSIAQDALQDRKQFHLVAIAALSLCISTDERIVHGHESLAIVSAKMYSTKEIKEMESNLLHGLSSGIHALTSIQIARRFLELALPGVDLESSKWCCFLDDVHFQTEYAVRDYYFTTQWPSTLAMAAILNAFDDVTGQDRQVMLRVLPSLVREHIPSFRDLVDAKHRLQVIMERVDYANDATDVSDSSVEILEKILAGGRGVIGMERGFIPSI